MCICRTSARPVATAGAGGASATMRVRRWPVAVGLPVPRTVENKITPPSPPAGCRRRGAVLAEFLSNFSLQFLESTVESLTSE